MVHSWWLHGSQLHNQSGGLNCACCVTCLWMCFRGVTSTLPPFFFTVTAVLCYTHQDFSLACESEDSTSCGHGVVHTLHRCTAVCMFVYLFVWMALFLFGAKGNMKSGFFKKHGAQIKCTLACVFLYLSLHGPLCTAFSTLGFENSMWGGDSCGTEFPQK